MVKIMRTMASGAQGDCITMKTFTNYIEVFNVCNSRS